MIGINLKLDGDGAWPDLKEKIQRGELIHLADGSVFSIVPLAGGMESGRTSVGIRFDLPDGKVLVVETSLALFLNAAQVLKAKFPNG